MTQIEIVADKIKKDIKAGIGTTTGQVSEGFGIDKPPEWRMKKVDKCGDAVLHE